jgi:hypothetical protein
MIRSPGLAGDPPAWFGRDPDLPRAVHAGPWIAQHGQFFDGWGRRAAHAELPALAAAQAAGTGWVKLIGDWMIEDSPLPVEVLKAVVDAVHAVGGRLAVHSQQAAGGAACVEAGVDSVEHGMCLDPGLLDRMAAQGTALTPTLSVITQGLAQARDRPDSPRRRWYVSGAEAHGALAAAAVEAGVVVLAGTDSRPHGRIVDEVRALASAGVPLDAAIAAASWAARAYLGLCPAWSTAPLPTRSCTPRTPALRWRSSTTRSLWCCVGCRSPADEHGGRGRGEETARLLRLIACSEQDTQGIEDCRSGWPRSVVADAAGHGACTCGCTICDLRKWSG